MRLLRQTNIDFMKYRKFWVAVSFATILAAAFLVFFHGQLNIGIDFAGGTQVTLKFAERPDVQALRDLLAGSGYREAVIQSFGKAGDNEVMLRTPILPGSEEGSGAQVLAALNTRFNPQGGGALDLNQQGADALAGWLAERDPDGVGATAAADHYAGVADAIMAVRKGSGIVTSWDQLAGAPGVSGKVTAALREGARLGSFSVLSLENVGPQVGSELRKRGVLAVVFSLLGMLVYIWIRFELSFGIGAVMASLHDVLITLGLFAFFGFEFNLTTIAAFLTLVGYSVNDTVVTFDRIRENMRKHRGEKLIDVMNRSINQVLSRTILTGGTTILASGTLLAIGGDVIRGFAFVMTVGVVVGTYSSMYIASPFALLWEQMMGKKGGAAVEKQTAQPARRAPEPNGRRSAPRR